MAEFPYNFIMIYYRCMILGEKSKLKDLDLQLKQYIIENFRYFVNLLSIFHEIRHLCLSQMKTVLRFCSPTLKS